MGFEQEINELEKYLTENNFEIETGDRLLILGDKAKGMAIVKLGSIPNFD